MYSVFMQIRIAQRFAWGKKMMVILLIRFVVMVVPAFAVWFIFQGKQKRISRDCVIFVLTDAIICYLITAIRHRDFNVIVYYYRLSKDMHHLVIFFVKNFFLSGGGAIVLAVAVNFKFCRNKRHDVSDYDRKEDMAKRRIGKSMIICVVFVAATICCLYPLLERWRVSNRFDYSWAAEELRVAHGIGGINGYTRTNSKEAFLENYELGFRVFEIDLMLTEDGIPVLSHSSADWYRMVGLEKDSIAFTYDNFISGLLYGEYHPMDYKDLVDIMSEYSDIYVDIDSKSGIDALTWIRNYANEVNPEILDRLIIEINKKSELDMIMEIYPWKSVKYCLYINPDYSERDAAEFCLSSGVKLVSVGMIGDELMDKLLDELNPIGIMISVHGVNDPEEAAALFGRGVTMLNTDFLPPL